ncbi:MAG: 3-dehydroquinate synthase, partial [Chloroflexi bacterium]|nr:3-dehydroquinate synthase [Chloroflexota bacterium]
MRTVRAELGARSYDIRVGAGLLAQAAGWLKELGFDGKLVIITDPMVKRLHGDRLADDLSAAGFNVISLVVAGGEANKSLDNAARLYRELMSFFAERSTPILAVGGGIIGDLAGFVASTYLRGVPFVQVPTTLLAQVDAGIGGKTAVNHGDIKNNIGTFYQPRLVIADTDVLKTLPEAEILNGLAEVIKSAAIADKDFFTFLEANLKDPGSVDASMREEIVFRCARIKAGIVAADERDLGQRHILNYGH